MRRIYFIFAVIFCASAIACFFYANKWFVPVLLAVAGFLVYKGEGKTKKLTLKLGKMDAEAADMLQESFDKAVTDFNFIQSALQQIKDRDLVKQLQKMQHISRNFLYYLKEHPQKISSARKFIDYYQDRAAALTEKYIELEQTGLAAGDVQNVKERMKETLSSFDEAYEEQFLTVLNHQVMDIDAELTVMEQNFAEDGIHDEDKKEDTLDSMLQKHGPDEKGTVSHSKVFASGRSGTGQSVIPPGEKGRVIKTKLIAAVLGIFFGAFGAHKFYLGKTGMGVLYLLFCWTFIPGLVGLVEGMRYLFMQLDDFYFEYCH